MLATGLDIGSRTVKLVAIEGGRVVLEEVAETTHDPLGVCHRLLDGARPDRLVVTGYGRHLVQRHVEAEAVTEIRAAAAGARHLRPAARTVIDIGGQDTKAIALDDQGRVRKFEMNDKCAAGTGRFLEVMATALAYTLDEFAAAACSAPAAARVNSMCTVFAESEVVSLVARRTPRDQLALGIHAAIAERTAAMARRLLGDGEVFFCGGVARNGCVRARLAEELGRPVHTPDNPQTVAALGCALLAGDATP
ncbi:MAG TPA: acyl-CoA dehydratase activase [Thermoanaerobaculaceae bacterium]|nr:acyl-CoA dehydratase activase [Thermoanaerobaculaceae bacterium]HRS16909.1 acyl-CoA dehydratase activase [Thermoanaerobaculaceae bacterium]